MPKKWLFLTVALIILFIAGYELRPKLEIVSDKITQEAPKLGPGAHLLLPNLQNAKVVAPDRPHDPAELQNPTTRAAIKRLRQFSVSTNSLGFRSPEVLNPKKGVRILCLGDSVTFGWGVSEEESYPALLHKSLGVEVINAGVPAMKPRHIAQWSQQLSFLSPDIVLFARRPDWSSPDAMQSYQNAVQTIKRNFPQAKFGIILPPISSFDPRGLSQAPTERKEITKRLSGIPFLDLTPIFHDNMPPKGFRLQQNDQQQQMIRREDGSVFAEGSAHQGLADEIIRAFEENSTIQEPLFFDGGHPDAEGFVLFSAQVEEWMHLQGWI